MTAFGAFQSSRYRGLRAQDVQFRPSAHRRLHRLNRGFQSL